MLWRRLITIVDEASAARLAAVPADAGEARVRASVLRMGRKLVFGEVRITTPDDQLAAHVTTTYALL